MIVRVSLDDKQELELMRLAYASVHAIPNDIYTEAQKEAWIPSELKLESFAFEQTYVYLLDGEIVGFIDVKENGYVNYLFVHPNHQRQGIATALYQYVEERVLSLRVFTFYTHASIVAKSFFEKEGYEVTEEEIVERGGEKLKRFVMTKRLSYE